MKTGTIDPFTQVGDKTERLTATGDCSGKCETRKFCDVSCDVTLLSKPVQVDAKACYVSPFKSSQRPGRFLRSCNLRSLVLTPYYLGL
jgi:hypothetical protein